MERVTQAEIEAQMDGESEDYRAEYWVEQVSPDYRVRRYAYLLLRDPALSLSRADTLLELFSDAVRGVFRAVDGADLKAQDSVYYRGLPDGILIEIGHRSDRCLAGYANVYRAIQSLAPHVCDTRFFVTEDAHHFVDEYRIEDGVMHAERRFADDRYAVDLRKHWIARCLSEPEDRELSRFVGWILANHAKFILHSMVRGSALKRGRAAKKRARKEGVEGRERRKNAELEKVRRLEDALEALERALQIDPECVEACELRALAAELDGDSSSAHTWRVMAATKGGRPELLLAAALDALDQGDHEAAAMHARWIVERHPEHRAALHVLGYCSEDVTALAHARALAHDPEDRRKLAGSSQAAQLLSTFYDAWEDTLEDTELARRRLARDMSSWVSDVNAHHPGLAHELLSRARRHHELDGELLYLTATVCPGEHPPAIYLEHALRLNPLHMDSVGALGRLAHEEGRHEDALALLDRYLRGTKGSSEMVRDLKGRLLHCCFHLARAHYEAGRYEQADLLYDDVNARTNGVHADAWVGKAFVAAMRSDFASAVGFYERALDLKPECPFAWSGLGSAFCNLGRYDEALTAHAFAEELDATYWHPPYGRACVLALTHGERDEIFALLKQALVRDPHQRAVMKNEPDLAMLTDDPRFHTLFGESPVHPPVREEQPLPRPPKGVSQLDDVGWEIWRDGGYQGLLRSAQSGQLTGDWLRIAELVLQASRGKLDRLEALLPMLHEGRRELFLAARILGDCAPVALLYPAMLPLLEERSEERITTAALALAHARRLADVPLLFDVFVKNRRMRQFDMLWWPVYDILGGLDMPDDYRSLEEYTDAVGCAYRERYEKFGSTLVYVRGGELADPRHAAEELLTAIRDDTHISGLDIEYLESTVGLDIEGITVASQIQRPVLAARLKAFLDSDMAAGIQPGEHRFLGRRMESAHAADSRRHPNLALRRNVLDIDEVFELSLWDWTGDGYAEMRAPFSTELPSRVDDKPWVAFATALKLAKLGQDVDLSPLITLLSRSDDVIHAVGCVSFVEVVSEALADMSEADLAAAWRERILHGDPNMSALLCRALARRGLLADLPLVLQAYRRHPGHEDFHYLHELFNELFYFAPDAAFHWEYVEQYVEVCLTRFPFGSVSAFCDAMEAEVRRCVRVSGTDQVVWFRGQVYDVRRVAQEILHIEDPQRLNEHLRYRFEAATGMDCSGFFDGDDPQLDVAHELAKAFMASPSVQTVKVGERYFWGRKISKAGDSGDAER